MEAGFGNDRLLDGGPGDDLLHANRGSDRMVYGGPGRDIVIGGAGNDVVAGGDGDDWLEGGDGRDLLDGGPGNDVILPGSGFNIVRGGPGDDVMTTGVLMGTYDCGPGEDVVHASWGFNSAPQERRRIFPNCETVLARLTDPGYVEERDLVGRGVNAALLKAGGEGRAKLDLIDAAYAAQTRRVNGIGTEQADFIDVGRDGEWLGRLGDPWVRGLGGADHLEGSSR